jgi:uncharacterized protein (DUF2062 family)
MKPWLKKWLVSPKMLKEHPGLARVHHLMSHPAFWSYTRRTSAPAVAIGIGIMFLPLPLQMLWAALLAIYFKANIPIAVSLTWLNNPFTFIPVNFFIYTTGNHLLWWIGGVERLSLPITRDSMPSLDTIFSWFLSLGKPYLVGLVFLISVCSFLGYVLTTCFWRTSASKARKKRRSPRSKTP